jgi:hypothetical protein
MSLVGDTILYISIALMPDVPDGRTDVIESCGIRCCIFQLTKWLPLRVATVDNLSQ